MKTEVIETPKFRIPEEAVDSAMVVVADDDTAIRNLLSGLLKAEGCRVFGAQDGHKSGLPATILRPNYFFQNDVSSKSQAYPMPIGSPTGLHQVFTEFSFEKWRSENSMERS